MIAVRHRWARLTGYQRSTVLYAIISFLGIFLSNLMLLQYDIPSIDPILVIGPEAYPLYFLWSIIFLGCFISLFFHIGILWATRRNHE